MDQTGYYFILFLLLQVTNAYESDNLPESNIQYTKKNYITKPNFQQRPNEQRIFYKPLISENADFGRKPPVPDPLQMPYPSLYSPLHNADGTTVRFEPKFLDFSQVTIGLEDTRTVKIFNLDKKEPLFIKSMSSPSSHFTPRPSGLSDHTIRIPPESNATIEVIFVPILVGPTEQTIFLICEERSLSYQVMGEGIESPFKIKPFIGAKIPLNSSYSPLLRIHNPEAKMMQILSLYTSGSRLQFQPTSWDEKRPTTEDIFPALSFQIYPFEDKILGYLTFMGVETGLQEAYVRIKYRHVDNDEIKSLLIPVQVLVKDSVGIYTSDPVLDFGVVRTHDQKKTLPINILNSGIDAREVHVDWIRQLPLKESSLKIHFKEIRLQPNSDVFNNIANLTFSFDQKQVERNSAKDFSGHIKVHVKNFGQTPKYSDLVIPWRARMLDGHLDISENDRRFILSEIREEGLMTKDVQVRNTLAMPVILYKIELRGNSESHFSIEDFDEPVVIQPLSKSTVFKLRFNACETVVFDNIGQTKCPEDINVQAGMILHTNASAFEYSINYHSGRLKYQTMTGKVLDFGLSSSQETKCSQIIVQNFNPLDIMVYKSSTLDKLTVYPISTFKINDVTNLKKGYYFEHKRIDSTSFPVKLVKNSTMFFECCISTTKEEHEFKDVLNLVTDHQTLRIPVVGQFTKGSLHVKGSPLKLYETSLSEGNPTRVNVTLFSTFSQIFTVTEVISAAPRDVMFVPYKNVKIRPNINTNVGTLVYNSSVICPPGVFGCVGSLRENSSDKAYDWHFKPVSSMSRQDSEYYLTFRKKYEDDIKRSLLLITNLQTTVEFEVQARVKMPKLIQVENNELHFPPTVVTGNQPVTGQKMIRVYNPSNEWIIVQAILLNDIRPHNHLLESLKSDYPWINNPKVKHSNNFRIAFTANTRFPKWSLAPGQNLPIHLGFFPEEARDHEAVLIIRNNLTVVEPLRMIGRGIEESLKFPENNDQIIMTMTRADLTDCYKEQNQAGIPFKDGSINKIKIQNYASIGSTITNITINGFACRGGGWEVMDCMGSNKIPPTYIPATTQQKEDGGITKEGDKEFKLRYRADFSLLQTEATMVITTKHGKQFVFSLIARVPQDHISACRAAIPRPAWEPPCRRVILIMMVVLLIGIFLMGFIEANYIIEPWLVNGMKPCPSTLTENYYHLLARMYDEYFKFLDIRNQVRQERISRFKPAVMVHEETVNHIFNSNGTRNRMNSLDSGSSTTKSSRTLKKNGRQKSRTQEAPKCLPREESVASSNVETSSLVDLDSENCSESDYKQYPNDSLGDKMDVEDEESIPDWMEDENPPEDDLHDIRGISEQTSHMWDEEVTKPVENEYYIGSNSDSEHNLLTPPQSESPLPSAQYDNLGELFQNYGSLTTSVPTYETIQRSKVLPISRVTTPRSRESKSKLGMNHLVRNIHGHDEYFDLKQEIQFNPAPGRPNRSINTYYNGNNMGPATIQNQRVYPYSHEIRDYNKAYDTNYMNPYCDYRFPRTSNQDVFSYLEPAPNPRLHPNPPPGFSNVRSKEQEHWRNLFSKDQKRKRSDGAHNKVYDQKIKNIWEDN